MDARIKNRLVFGVKKLEASMEKIGETHINRIKPTLERAIKSLWEKYEKYGILDGLHNTQASFGWSNKIAPADWTETQERAFERFEKDRDELAELLYMYDDPHYCPQLLFTYDGKDFQWWK